jgi:uncharacterized membrane protein
MIPGEHGSKPLWPATAISFAILLSCILSVRFVWTFDVPDEPAHFIRVATIASSHNSILTLDGVKGYAFSKNILAVSNNARHGELRTVAASGLVNGRHSEEFPELFNPASTYSLFSYIPQALAYKLVLIQKGTLKNAYVLGKILASIAFLCIYFAVMTEVFARRTCSYSTIFLLPLLSLPMSIYQATSISADSSIIVFSAVAVYSVSKISQVVTNSGKIIDSNRVRTIGFYVAAVTIASLAIMSKIAYAPISLWLCCVPYNVQAWNKKSTNSKGLTITNWAAFTAIIIGLAERVFTYRQHSGSTLSALRNISGAAHGKDMTADIVSFAPKLLTTITRDNFPQFYIESFLGNFGWLNKPLTAGQYSFMFTCFFTIVLVSIYINSQIGSRPQNTPSTTFFISKKLRLLLLLAALCSVFLMFFILHISWNPASSPLINGIQGRYFIPIAMFTPLVIFENSGLPLASAESTQQNQTVTFAIATSMIISGCFIAIYISALVKYYILPLAM